MTFVLHSYHDNEVEWFVTTNLEEASKFFLTHVCGLDDETYLTDCLNRYMYDDEQWNVYSKILKYCINRGVDPEYLKTLFPKRMEMIMNAQSLETFESLTQTHSREAVWFICFLFQKFNITATIDDLTGLSIAVIDAGDGPGYPHVLFDTCSTGNFEV